MWYPPQRDTNCRISIVIQASEYIPRIHCELYPNNREVESKNGLLMELRETVMHASAGQNASSLQFDYLAHISVLDIITSDKSLSPFGGEELSKILDLISHLQGAQNFSHTLPRLDNLYTTETTSEECRPHSMCVIGASLILQILSPKYSDVSLSAIYAIFRYVCLYINISAISSLRNSPSQVLQLLRSTLCTFRSWPVNISYERWACGKVRNFLGGRASMFRCSPSPLDGTAKSLGR